MVPTVIAVSYLVADDADQYQSDQARRLVSIVTTKPDLTYVCASQAHKGTFGVEPVENKQHFETFIT
eukprot:1586500-Prymnesium_polylepis.1